jgi:hypothetical protein
VKPPIYKGSVPCYLPIYSHNKHSPFIYTHSTTFHTGITNKKRTKVRLFFDVALEGEGRDFNKLYEDELAGSNGGFLEKNLLSRQVIWVICVKNWVKLNESIHSQLECGVVIHDGDSNCAGFPIIASQ